MSALQEIKLEKIGGKSLPLYEQIRRQIKQLIESNILENGDRLPTVASLVKQWDVDYSTVKSAFDLLAGDGLLRLEPRRGAVVTNSAPCEVFTMMFVRWGTDALIVDIAEGLQQYCSENNQKLICSDARLSHENFLDAIMHPPKDIDGLILLPLSSPEYVKAISDAVNKGTKILFIHRTLPEIPVSSVAADNFAAGYRATSHLLETHKQPVFYFGMPKKPSCSREAFEGWAEAMRQSNYHNLEEHAWDTNIDETDPKTYLGDIRQIPKEHALKFLKQHKQEKYSIFASNDYLAQGLYLAAEELGLTIGKDIYVVGMGDLPFCAVMEPPLSSVYQSRKELGYEAAKLLHQELSGDLHKPTHRVLPVELRVRQSSEGNQANQAIE